MSKDDKLLTYSELLKLDVWTPYVKAYRESIKNNPLYKVEKKENQMNVNDEVMYDGNLGIVYLIDDGITEIRFYNGLVGHFTKDTIKKVTPTNRRRITKTFYTGVRLREDDNNFGVSLDGLLVSTITEASKRFPNDYYNGGIAKVEIEVFEEEVR
jgi:hypothetical protein